MSKENLKIAPPWLIYAKRVHELFKNDPEVHVEYDEYENEVKIFVDNGRKYDAIYQLLKPEVTFGNVVLKVTVVPANANKEATWSDLFTDAFAGNPIFSHAEHIEGQLGTFDFILFNPVIAQYFSDNLFDIHGATTELYQDLAKEVFDTGDDMVRFCTDIVDKDVERETGKPLGEWP